MLDPALQSVGKRASLPALKPTGQSAADSPKGSRQVLAHVPGHLQPFGSTFERVEHEGCSGNRFAKDCVSSRIANRQQLDEISLLVQREKHFLQILIRYEADEVTASCDRRHEPPPRNWRFLVREPVSLPDLAAASTAGNLSVKHHILGYFLGPEMIFCMSSGYSTVQIPNLRIRMACSR